MNGPVLLAKSDGTGLKEHTEEVVRAAKRIHAILEAPDLARAAFYHDVGKGTKFFQTKMRGNQPENWYRHELFSLLIACSVSEHDGLTDFELAAIATHHKNLSYQERDGSPGLLSWTETQDAADLLAALAQRELTAHWGELERIFGELPTPNYERAGEFLKRIRQLAEQNTIWEPEGLRLGMHRAALVAADHLASSRVGLTVKGDNVTADSLEHYAKNGISAWQNWNVIQQTAQNTIGTAVLVAPTGTGKTEAALLWALANRQRYERIFYVLPYQVSINAMAERIAKAFPDDNGNRHIHDNDNVSVLHSNMDLAYLQDALNDELPQQRAYAIALANKDAARKIYAPIKVTTVYQLLDIFFGRKFFEVGLLELKDSLVIFDEIHAYDGHTMGLILVLLKYLRRLNARIFIMTATLPSKLRDELRNAAGVSSDEDIRPASSDPLLLEVRRQIVTENRSIEEMIPSIRQMVDAGKKTAVVCNTVTKAIQMWDLLKNFQPLLVHSRFTLGDRASRETKENIANYALVIATQVIEVSLDVSFDAMFSELAPVDSLLQRFGRVNRHGQVDPGNLGICYVACGNDPGSRKIYDPVLLVSTQVNIPSAPLTFQTACDWIEQVYPQGLSENAGASMEQARDNFDRVVAQLRPMLDPAIGVDTEKTLIDSVQVIPEKYAKSWAELKESGKHLEAKHFIVSLNLGSWRSALAKCANIGARGYRQHRDWTIALFNYDNDRGLLLDEPSN
jgi:CRISPR-associated endonuclease/helicase Cas3